MKKITLVFLGIFILPGFLLAATDEFTIKVMGGGDTIPPSTPTLLTVEPVASSQIDISWSVAVDNYLLSGYVLSRDGLPIATTTLTSFIDTGLNAETLYSYEVYAFDSAGNISTTSNQLATTTLAIPVISTSTPIINSPTSSTRVIAIKDLKIITDNTTAHLIWQTNFPARYALRWGQTDSYTGGYVLNEAYREDNETTITDLEPGTNYYYELIGYTPNGISIVLSKGQFTTQASSLATFVPNVTRLQSEVEGNSVILKWLLPENTPIKSIRVVRSHLGFPTDSSDGAIVFDGVGSIIRDVNALQFYQNQYYSVFVVGEDGTISSGAVILVRQNEAVVILGGEGVATISSASSSPEVEEIPLFGLDVQDILLQQDEQGFSFFNERINLLNTRDFTISIRRDALLEHLKSIIVTLLDPTDQRRSYSFLLRINKEGTAYEATIAPLWVVGASRLQVEIFDFERKLVGRYRKPVDFINPPASIAPVIFPDAILFTAKEAWPILALMLLVICLILILVWRRHNHTIPN